MNLTHSIKPIRQSVLWHGKDFQLAGGRLRVFLHTVKGILANLACADKGELEVDADIIPCEMVFIASK